MTMFWQASILQPVILTLICMFASTMCDEVEFTPVESDGAVCPSATPVSSARSDIECAVVCTGNPNCRSFGHASPFVEGSCLVSEIDNCTLMREGKTFRKKILSDCFSPSGPTVMFLQRFAGDVTFNRSWSHYDNGFGNCGGDFWLGLRNIKNLLGSSSATLRVEMKQWTGEPLFVEFNGFTVGNSSTNYMITYTAMGDRSSEITMPIVDNNTAFSTMERDNDKQPGACSHTYNGNGGFWMSSCGMLFPTAVFPSSSSTTMGYMCWYKTPVGLITLKEVRLYLKR